jgi:hypothetical protein
MSVGLGMGVRGMGIIYKIEEFGERRKTFFCANAELCGACLTGKRDPPTLVSTVS